MWVLGIHEGHGGPFPSHQYYAYNWWQDFINDQGYQVYAVSPYVDPGAERPRLGDAELLLYSHSTDPSHLDLRLVGTYPPPKAESMLTLTDVQGVVLTVHGASGATYRFNVLDRNWS